MMGQNEIENSNDFPPRESRLNSEILSLSIQLPKILVPCIDEICRMTQRNRDDLFSQFVICGLVGFYQEPEMIINFTKRIPNFSERFRKGLNQYYGKEHFKDKKAHRPENLTEYNSADENKSGQAQSNKELNNEGQIFEFKVLYLIFINKVVHLFQLSVIFVAT